jgi:lysophospholipase L1-like esterase
MTGTVHPAAVAAKGIALFIAIELVFVSIGPQLDSVSVYALPRLKRERFPVSTLAPVDAALDVGNLQAMFASHVVSNSKGPDEFRIMVLGDSATWGTQDRVDEMMPAQLNDLGLACGSRKVKAYNLSFPRSSATKDLMIMDDAMSYKPDMFIWMITWYTLMPKTRVDHALVTQNPEEFYNLARRFDFLPRDYPAPTWLDNALSRNRSFYRVARYQLYSLIQLATGVDQLPGPPIDVPGALTADTTFEGLKPPTLRQAQVSLDQVADALKLAGGVPIILVNEPMQVLSGVPNSDVRYNGYYPRWVYDQYRQYLREAATQKGWDYLDLWNAFPASDFGDTPLHLVPKGQRELAQMLAPAIQKYCQ